MNKRIIRRRICRGKIKIMRGLWMLDVICVLEVVFKDELAFLKVLDVIL